MEVNAMPEGMNAAQNVSITAVPDSTALFVGSSHRLRTSHNSVTKERR
jgi:hypothetical protein